MSSYDSAPNQPNKTGYQPLGTAFDKDVEAKLNSKIVTDENGKRRFHGAFTGGWSAGYFNTVGSKEGWAPSQFKSSRVQKADRRDFAPEDFMDEEDKADMLGRSLQAKKEFNAFPDTAAEFASHILPGSMIPGPIPSDLVVKTDHSIGKRLLRQMGWREGHGVGPRMRRKRKAPAPQATDAPKKKVYGVDLGLLEHDDDDDDDDGAVPDDATFAPKNVEVALEIKPKTDTFGVGFDPYTAAEEFRGTKAAQLGLTTTKSKHAGFGVGALEDDDDPDVYGGDDLSNYDIALNTMKAKAKAAKQGNPEYDTSRVCSDGRRPLRGFIVVATLPANPIWFNPPEVPESFQEFHYFDDIIESDQAVPNHTISAKERGALLNESLTQPTSTQTPAPTGPASVFDLLSKADKERLMAIKQQTILKQLPQPSKEELEEERMREEQRQREQDEKRKKLFQPLSFAIASRFTAPSDSSERFLAASVPTGQPLTTPDPSKKQPTTQETSYQETAASLNMFGKLTREDTEWRPASLLCKRFNLRDPYQGMAPAQRTRRENALTTQLAPDVLNPTQAFIDNQEQAEATEAQRQQLIATANTTTTTTTTTAPSTTQTANTSTPPITTTAPTTVLPGPPKPPTQNDGAPKADGGAAGVDGDGEEEDIVPVKRPPIDLFKAIFEDDDEEEEESAGDTNNNNNLDGDNPPSSQPSSTTAAPQPTPSNQVTSTGPSPPSSTATHVNVPPPPPAASTEDMDFNLYGPAPPPPSSAPVNTGFVPLAPIPEAPKKESKSKDKKGKDKKKSDKEKKKKKKEKRHKDKDKDKHKKHKHK